MGSARESRTGRRAEPLRLWASFSGSLPSNRNGGFTLIEVLVVIAVIAVPLAILIPVTSRARELGQRAVCLGNLRQLTLAWTSYADDNGGRLVEGCRWSQDKGWVGYAFDQPQSRSALWEDPDKGLLWPYLRDIDVYRCPRGRRGHACTYEIVCGANGTDRHGRATDLTSYLTSIRQGKGPSNRVGRTVLRLARLTDIMTPGASNRAVFVDIAQPGNCFTVSYFDPEWHLSTPPPVHHANGTTFSFADGHAEYWKWGRETVALRREVAALSNGLYVERFPRSANVIPQTPEGRGDLKRTQRAVWGRLGYADEEEP